MAKFTPLHDRIAVKQLEQQEKTVGGIIIPDNAKEKPMQGEVISVGSGSRNDKGDIIPMSVSVGDTILFGKWAGTEVEIGGQKLMIMKESDVLGIIS